MPWRICGVAMYSHRSLSLGAVVVAMIATSGDESFVMFAMIPKTALLLTSILFVLGVLSGALADKFLGRPLRPSYLARLVSACMRKRIASVYRRNDA